MRRRKNPKAKVEEEEEDEERLEIAKEEKEDEAGWKAFIKSVNTDDDDDEANEDLSLKIVEKSLQMRSAKRNPREEALDLPMSNGAGGSGPVDFCGGSSITEVEAVEQTNGVALVDEIVVSEVDSVKRKRTKKLKKVEAAEERTAEVVEEEKVDEAGQSQTTDKIDSADRKTAEIIDNIVLRKSLQMRSAKRNPREEALDLPMSNGAGGSGPVDFCGGSSITEVEAVKQTNGVALVDEIVVSEVDSVKRKRTKKLKKVEAAEERTEVVEEEKVDEAGQSQTTDKIDSADRKTAEIIDNIVLRKLLRGPRYFDPPDSSWGTCFNCGEEGHSSINCTSARRKKPCFVCGSLDHNAKQCSKGQDCFICKKGGHRAKDCPERGKIGSEIPRVCLKCGQHGHDMFSCKNDYSSEDLKEIQCYVCNKFGHLCCFNTSDTGPRELSCYKCGQLGHTGLACSRLRGEATDAGSLTSCYRCGEEGHFARECPNSSKVAKRRREPSTPRTPTRKFHREGKDKKASRSAPNDIGKSLKKKKIQSEDKGHTTPRKSKHRGGWMAEHPGDYSPVKSKKNKWKSPASPSIRSTGWTGTRQLTDSQSPNGWKYHSRTQVPYESPNVFRHQGYASQGPANGLHHRNFVGHQSSDASHNRYSVSRWSGHGDYHSNARPNYRYPAARFDHNGNATRSNYSWW